MVALLPGWALAADGWSLVDGDDAVFATARPEADMQGPLGDFQIGCVVGRTLNVFYTLDGDYLTEEAKRPTSRMVMQVDPGGSDVIIVSDSTRWDTQGRWTFSMDQRHLADFGKLIGNATRVIVGVVPTAMTTAQAREALFEHGFAFIVDRDAVGAVMKKCAVPSTVELSPDEAAEALNAPDGQWTFSREFPGGPTVFVNFRGRRMMMSCDGEYADATVSVPASEMQDRWITADISVAPDFATQESVTYMEDAKRYDSGVRSSFGVTVTRRWLDDARKAKARLIVGLVFNPDESIWTEFPVRGSTAAIKQLLQTCD